MVRASPRSRRSCFSAHLAARARSWKPDGTSDAAAGEPGGDQLLRRSSRGFPAAADTLAGLFMYHEINGVAAATRRSIRPRMRTPHRGPSRRSVVSAGRSSSTEAGARTRSAGTTRPIQPTVPKNIYPIVPANLTQPPPNGISCVDNRFLSRSPLGRRRNPQHTWADPLPDFAANIRNDPTGRVVKWASRSSGAPTADLGAPRTKYSQADINDHSPAGGTTKGAPWITTLIYQSIADPNGYYIAFEDQPMCTLSWRGCTSGNPPQANTPGNGNDGDFNDFVFYVSGIDCAGGGQACDSGMPGICAGGTTQCANGGMDIKCRQDIQARPETCNLLDDDCDGIIDNPDAPGLCPTGQVCSRGVCVSPCSPTEFPCGPPTVCDTTDGLCKDPACMNANCAMDQICDQGVCVGGCDGVVCPPGQVCRIGNCVDPCQGITCGSGQVCEGGACLAACGCRNCPSGKVCSLKAAPDPSAGTCIDKGCDKVTCKAPMVCVQGECKDGCAGVQCPAAQVCSDGQCAIPDGRHRHSSARRRRVDDGDRWQHRNGRANQHRRHDRRGRELRHRRGRYRVGRLVDGARRRHHDLQLRHLERPRRERPRAPAGGARCRFGSPSRARGRSTPPLIGKAQITKAREPGRSYRHELTGRATVGRRISKSAGPSSPVARPRCSRSRPSGGRPSSSRSRARRSSSGRSRRSRRRGSPSSRGRRRGR